MESFEGLGLSPELVEALAAEGVEEPSPFQMSAIPVLRRGNNLLGRTGPGAGTLIAYGAALLDRFEPGSGTPKALVLTPGDASARRLAESLARLASATGHGVAAAGTPWVLPERADILFGAPATLLGWVREGRLDVQAVESLVLEQASALQRMLELDDVEALIEFLPREGQRIVLALPTTPEIEDFVERHVRRAVQLPAQTVEAAAASAPRRGEVRYRIVEERESGVLPLVAELLEDARHVCLYFGNEDRAADVGDDLSLHGYAVGAPGDEGAPVWLGLDALAARERVADAGAVALSYDVPTGPDALDRRHGGGIGGVVLALPREMAHLKDVARRTGYRTVPFPPPEPARRSDLQALLARLDAATESVDVPVWLAALEPLLQRRGAAEVAAAAVALLRERPAAAGVGEAAMPAAPAAGTIRSSPAPSAPTAFVRLYISLGERDNVRPADLVGAIAGESGIEGSKVGRIEIRDTFSIVEVEEPVADRVIRALNGITVRGRSVRADYDRGPTGSRGGDRSEGGKPRGGRPGGKGGRPGGKTAAGGRTPLRRDRPRD